MGEAFATTEFESPIGELRIAVSTQGVLQLGLPISSGAGFRGKLHRSIPDGERLETLPVMAEVLHELEAYFAGHLKIFKVPLDLRGTDFQKSVWNALAEIPYGQTCSYADVATAVGHPHAFRAVGAANGQNPISIVLPCHRVIGHSGKLTGYAGGLDKKEKLLRFERDCMI